MILRDSAIHSPKVDSSENLVFTIKIKKEDYTEWMRQFIFNSYNEWKTLDLEVVWMAIAPDPDVMTKLRWDLGSLMNIYCQGAKIDIKDEVQRLYNRNWVTTRLDLTREQLETEIQKYRAWVYFE